MVVAAGGILGRSALEESGRIGGTGPRDRKFEPCDESIGSAVVAKSCRQSSVPIGIRPCRQRPMASSRDLIKARLRPVAACRAFEKRTTADLADRPRPAIRRCCASATKPVAQGKWGDWRSAPVEYDLIARRSVVTAVAQRPFVAECPTAVHRSIPCRRARIRQSARTPS